jgi:protein-S-isoprenylcysteine O-methyltransferase Ste14
MFVVFRAVTYATLFVGFVLVFLPSRVLALAGMVRPDVLGPRHVVGLILVAGGFIVGVWCIAAFALVGRGTPAPFDPPRHLVARGPYAVVRNPMYVGAVCALGGAALFYWSLALAGYAGLFLLVVQAVVVGYEEPALRRTFGRQYDDYCARVARWWPPRLSMKG